MWTPNLTICLLGLCLLPWRRAKRSWCPRQQKKQPGRQWLRWQPSRHRKRAWLKATFRSTRKTSWRAYRCGWGRPAQRKFAACYVMRVNANGRHSSNSWPCVSLPELRELPVQPATRENPERPLELSFSFTVPQFINQSGPVDLDQFAPALGLRTLYAKSTTRKFPLFIDSLFFDSTVFHVHLPEGLDVRSLPPDFYSKSEFGEYTLKLWREIGGEDRRAPTLPHCRCS